MRVHAPLEQTKLVISDIVKELEQKFPDLNISGADWQKLVEDLRTESRESEFEYDLGADGYIWIRGAKNKTSEAADLGQSLAADAWEKTGGALIIKTSSDIWCKKSSQDPNRGPQFIVWEHPKGITFLCLMSEQHDHDFGRLQKEFLSIPR